MKTFRSPFIVMILTLAVILSGCTAGPLIHSWPGVSATDTGAAVAAGEFVYSIDANTGTERCRFPAEGNPQKLFYAPPTLSEDGQMLIAGYDHVLYSVNPQSCQESWTFTGSKDRLVGSPAASADSIYVPSVDSHLYALDLQGNLRWSFKTNQALWAQPLLHEDVLYQAAMDHNLYALNPSDGSLIWNANLGGAIVNHPTLSADGQTLYAATVNREVMSVQAADGTIGWRTELQAGVWGAPVLHEDILVVGDQVGNIYWLDAVNGAIRYTQTAGSAITGTPAVVSDGVLFGLENGQLVKVNFQGGIVANYQIGGKLYSNLAISGEKILAALTDGPERSLLAAVDANGAQQWPVFVPLQK